MEISRIVSELADREAIRELVSRYCHYIYQGAFEDLVALFAPDGVLVPPANIMGDVAPTAREALPELLVQSRERFAPWPFAHNHVIELVDRSHARGFVHVEIRLGNENLRTANLNVYHDQYVKIEGAWKFLRREMTATLVP